MATDDERRRVAKELRDFFPIDLVSEMTDVDCQLSMMVMGDEFCPGNCLECFETVCERLADLIEPEDGTDPGPRDLARAWGWTNDADR